MQDADEKTPISTGSKEAQGIGELLDELRRLEGDLRSAASCLDQLAGDDRKALLKDLYERLRVIGGLGHDAARVIWNILHRRSG
jgi:hypothetical protein